MLVVRGNGCLASKRFRHNNNVSRTGSSAERANFGVSAQAKAVAKQLCPVER